VASRNRSATAGPFPALGRAGGGVIEFGGFDHEEARVTEVRQFRWTDYEQVAEVWRESGADVVPRAELEAKLVREPELFLVAGMGESIVGVVLGT
jgi:hypothetical protein